MVFLPIFTIKDFSQSDFFQYKIWLVAIFKGICYCKKLDKKAILITHIIFLRNPIFFEIRIKSLRPIGPLKVTFGEPYF